MYSVTISNNESTSKLLTYVLYVLIAIDFVIALLIGLYTSCDYQSPILSPLGCYEPTLSTGATSYFKPGYPMLNADALIWTYDDYNGVTNYTTRFCNLTNVEGFLHGFVGVYSEGHVWFMLQNNSYTIKDISSFPQNVSGCSYDVSSSYDLAILSNNLIHPQLATSYRCRNCLSREVLWYKSSIVAVVIAVLSLTTAMIGIELSILTFIYKRMKNRIDHYEKVSKITQEV
ncbi:hypothetical protein DM01DRAFT_1336360 [Hesseltinella vesiculosa]|uniref:Uncharacterized protein n=1 Tax=Hesseltinella vesiculosa TaxID=101127 RepID=A0A1X2GGI5_9FUNG|nr:hypothetical protein DM01DRAFT_1336360 [Hesseltinella vesiculosa]